jgi:hypothetical protein
MGMKKGQTNSGTWKKGMKKNPKSHYLNFEDCQKGGLISPTKFKNGHKGFKNSGNFKKGHISWNNLNKSRNKYKTKNFNKRKVKESHLIWCEENNYHIIPKGFLIHHRDLNSLNDSPDNLVLLHKIDHIKLHNQLIKELKKGGNLPLLQV